jgi:hypothetical protein
MWGAKAPTFHARSVCDTNYRRTAIRVRRGLLLRLTHGDLAEVEHRGGENGGCLALGYGGC